MNNHEIMYRIGFLAGILSGGILAILLVRLIRTDRTLKCKYDERQQLIQGRAFKYGFFSWMFFDGFCILADIGLEVRWLDRSTVLFLGMLVGMTVYVSYSIWHDGYFSMNQNPRKVLALLVLAAVLNMLCAARNIYAHQGVLENGVVSFHYSCNLLMAAFSVFLLSVMAVKSILDHKKPE